MGLFSSGKKKAEQEKALLEQEKALRVQEKALLERLEAKREDLWERDRLIKENIDSFNSTLIYVFTSRNAKYQQERIKMKDKVRILEKLCKEQKEKLDNLEDGILPEILIKQLIKRCNQEKQILDDKLYLDMFQQYADSAENLPDIVMMSDSDYGVCQQEFWDRVRIFSKKEADDYVEFCLKALNEKNIAQMLTIRIDELLRCVWFYATDKPYSVADFKRAASLFERLHKKEHIDTLLAELYAIKQMGGDSVLHDRIREMLKDKNTSPQKLKRLASLLMWIGEYGEERNLLQHMLGNGMSLDAHMQERLHTLATTGGKVPDGYNVQSDAFSLYFDVSALAWKEDSYMAMFDNLVFRDKSLAYSLAVRDENKELFIPQGIKSLNNGLVIRKLSDVMSEEYGDVVSVSMKICIAVSGSGEEKMEGILITSAECRQMGILMQLIRIGKKMNIKFYTLFMPDESDVNTQKQQALSLFKKLSPSVTMWESSLKDAVLTAVQQFLNEENQGAVGGGSASTSGDGPVF